MWACGRVSILLVEGSVACHEVDVCVLYKFECADRCLVGVASSLILTCLIIPLVMYPSSLSSPAPSSSEAYLSTTHH